MAKKYLGKIIHEHYKIHLSLSLVLISMGFLVALELSSLGGNIRFYTKWIECGQKPVATAGSGYLNNKAVHYFTPTSWPGSHPSIEYFCTPLQAELAGYSANADRYEFPHIDSQGR